MPSSVHPHSFLQLISENVTWTVSDTWRLEMIRFVCSTFPSLPRNKHNHYLYCIYCTTNVILDTEVSHLTANDWLENKINNDSTDCWLGVDWRRKMTGGDMRWVCLPARRRLGSDLMCVLAAFYIPSLILVANIGPYARGSACEKSVNEWLLISCDSVTDSALYRRHCVKPTDLWQSFLILKRLLQLRFDFDSTRQCQSGRHDVIYDDSRPMLC